MNGRRHKTHGTSHNGATLPGSSVLGPWPEILLPEEAAIFLRVHPDTLGVAMREQGLPYNKIGSKTVIEKSAIHEWLKKNRIREFGEENTSSEPIQTDLGRSETFWADSGRSIVV